MEARDDSCLITYMLLKTVEKFRIAKFYLKAGKTIFIISTQLKVHSWQFVGFGLRILIRMSMFGCLVRNFGEK